MQISKSSHSQDTRLCFSNPIFCLHDGTPSRPRQWECKVPLRGDTQLKGQSGFADNKRPTLRTKEKNLPMELEKTEHKIMVQNTLLPNTSLSHLARAYFSVPGFSAGPQLVANAPLLQPFQPQSPSSWCPPSLLSELYSLELQWTPAGICSCEHGRTRIDTDTDCILLCL